MKTESYGEALRFSIYLTLLISGLWGMLDSTTILQMLGFFGFIVSVSSIEATIEKEDITMEYTTPPIYGRKEVNK